VTSAADVQDALAAACVACANRAKSAAEDGDGTAAEEWASAAAQLAYAMKGTAGALPARPST